MAWQDLPTIFQPGEAWEIGWLPIVTLVTLTLSIFYSIMYVIGRTFNIPMAMSIAKYELFQIFATFFFAVSIVVILTETFTFILSIIGGGSYVVCDAYGKITLAEAGPIEAIRCNLMSKALQLTYLYEQMYISARDPFAEFYESFGLFGFPIYYQGAWLWQTEPSHLYQQVENYRFLNDVLTHFIIGIKANLGSIDYIRYNMLSMFLPIGIVLRAFPWTRGIGAFFISLAIGLYIIFPLIFFITDPTFHHEKDLPYSENLIDDPSRWCWQCFEGAASVATLPPQIGSTFSFQTMSLSAALSNVTQLYVGLILHPLAAFSITLIFIRYLTDLFGGESQELLRVATRLI